MRFEWDSEKETINYQKHKIHFKTAVNVFKDPNRIEFFDKIHSIQEERYITIGIVEDVIFVVYTIRTDNIRIISARIASKSEKRLYYGNC